MGAEYLIIAVFLNQGLCRAAHTSEKKSPSGPDLPTPEKNVPEDSFPYRIQCWMLRTRLSKGLPLGEGPQHWPFGMSRRTEPKPDGDVVFSFAHPFRQRIANHSPGKRFFCGRPGFLEEQQPGPAEPRPAEPRPAEPRRALFQLCVFCARGWLGGVYIKAQKGWSLTSAHSAAMRSFL